MLYNNYNETHIQFDWSIAVQDQAILHEELKCFFWIVDFQNVIVSL
jgi:hypothetical protein